ncbi:hypothetical protein [Trichormus variabilis]|uniref:Toxin co-regulated pilus biosynthesis protein Q C-terminal domain-containing protein n=1 Tax=Trichormus variabilis SAG 1403-4b TaxID=447716 RepID=A0A3S1ACI6_ANAVA|nr:hypothetical protein [Trichormus variabilis]MBD2627646.1 hypothetical protein [Trichormus variabilis FACHB-164]RUS97876.1 hypothetical protein DSM107003_17510 [Trichormus variabilis SAG 1403-4b]
MPKYNVVSKQKSLTLLLTLSLTTFCLSPIPPSSAESIPKPSDAPLELNLLNKPTDSVITANTINPERLTIPSLWWAKENSENKLLDNWIAYPNSDKQPARVDLIVNQQIWSLLDYLERYNFVNQMGSMARNFGYNIRVFNYQQEPLATYTCNFSNSPELCNIQMNNQSRLGLRQVTQEN